jgi:hypothetical protein
VTAVHSRVLMATVFKRTVFGVQLVKVPSKVSVHWQWLRFRGKPAVLSHTDTDIHQALLYVLPGNKTCELWLVPKTTRVGPHAPGLVAITRFAGERQACRFAWREARTASLFVNPNDHV